MSNELKEAIARLKSTFEKQYALARDAEKATLTEGATELSRIIAITCDTARLSVETDINGITRLTIDCVPKTPIA